MAEKRLRAEPPAFYVARQTFYHRGIVLVLAGHTVAAGHPILKGKDALFDAFEPTWPLSRRLGEPPSVAAPAPVEAESVESGESDASGERDGEPEPGP